MAKKEHKPSKSSRQVYAERKAAGFALAARSSKAAKDSVERLVCKAVKKHYDAAKKEKRSLSRADLFRSKADMAAPKMAAEVAFLVMPKSEAAGLSNRIIHPVGVQA
jgi:hypothetical protein